VEVLVEFGFSDPTYNQKWIFDSLEPTLLEVESNQKKFPLGLSASYFDKIIDGKHVEIFCFAKKAKSEPFTEFRYTYASHKASFKPRPVEWESTMLDGRKGPDGTAKYWYGKMGAISFNSLNGPDWIIMRTARWMYDAADLPLLEIELFNPRKAKEIGGKVHLWLSNTDIGLRCNSDAGTVEVPVTFSSGGCNNPIRTAIANPSGVDKSCPLNVLAPDPGDSRAVKRQVAFEKGGCGEVDAHLELGPTGTLAPESLTKLRYVFREKVASSGPINSQNRRNSENSLYSLNHRAVQIRQMSIFPKEIIATFARDGDSQNK